MKITSLLITLVATIAVFVLPSHAATFNGNFENGLQGWRIDNAPANLVKGKVEVQSDTAKVGTKALRLGWVSGKSLARVRSSRIPIPDSRNLEFRGWYQFEAEPGTVVEIDVIFYDAQQKPLAPIQKYWQRTHLTRSEEWKEFDIPLALHEKAHFMSVTMYYIGGKGQVILDDLQFAQLHPATTPSTGYLLSGTNSANAQFSVESSMMKVYADSAKPTQSKSAISLSAAKGETEAVQVVVWPKSDLTNLEVSFSDLGSDTKVLSKAVMRARFVESVTSPTQSAKGRAGAIPDLLSSIASTQFAANIPQSIWVDVHVPHDAKAGLYYGNINVKADEFKTVKLPLRIQIYDFALPEKPKLTTIVHDWGTPKNGKEVLWHNWKEHSVSGAASPIDPKIVPNSSGWNGLPPHKLTPELPVQVSADGKVTIDWTSWDKGTQKYFSQYGFTVFNVPNVYMGNVQKFFRGDNGKGSWFGLDVGSPIWKKAYSSYVKQVADHFRKQGIMKQALWQLWDEPKPKHYPFITLMADIIHKQAPDAQVLVTRQAVPELLGAVDIWVYPSSHYEQQKKDDPQLIKKLIKQGNKIFIYDNSLYTTDVDIAPYRLRVEPWMLYQNDITGLLWWASTYWKEDPRTTNGYGSFLYPNAAGNVDDSIRWENYRDGVEDYDYLYLLARAQDEALQKLQNKNPELSGNKLVKSLIKDISSAEPNVNKLLQLRDSIAAAIVQLKENPSAALTIKNTLGK